jgi:DNA-directed RNA polymerase specialized sigma24 family protein
MSNTKSDQSDHSDKDEEVKSAQEAEWVQRAGQGDQEAFNKLCDIYIDPIYIYLFNRVRSKSTAETLTFKVLAEATSMLAQGHYNSLEKPFKLSLYSIARNVLLEGDYQSPSTPFPKEQDILWQLIPELSFAEQDILMMHLLDQLSFTEIALLLNCSERDSRHSYSQAISKLNQLAKEKGAPQ